MGIAILARTYVFAFSGSLVLECDDIPLGVVERLVSECIERSTGPRMIRVGYVGGFGVLRGYKRSASIVYTQHDPM